MEKNNNTLDVGSIEDIVEIWDYYFDNMCIERVGKKHALISLPQNKSINIKNLNFVELVELTNNILKGYVKIIDLPENSSSWNDRLKSLADIFFSKYGIILYVDKDKKIHLSNVSTELQNQLIRKHGRNISIINEIESLITNSKYDEALNKCNGIIGDSNTIGLAYYYIGEICLAQNKKQEAINAFYLAYNNDHNRIESLSNIASIYFNEADYQKAIEIYQSIQDEKGYDVKIWSNIGICYNRLMLYDKAIECFNKGILMDPNDAFPYYNLGVSYFMMKQYDLFRVNMEKAIEIDPTNKIYSVEYQKCLQHIGFDEN